MAIAHTLIEKRLQRERGYWLRRLAGLRARSGLPTDYARPAEFRDSRASVQQSVAPEVAARLNRMCAGNGSLIFSALVAAAKICVYKYSGEEDVAFGMPIHARHKETAALNKVLVLRDRVADQTRVKSFLAQVKRHMSEAYEYQKFPFESLLRAFEIDIPPHRAPWFDVVVVSKSFHNKADVDGLKQDMSLVFAHEGGDLDLEIEYQTSLFKAETIRSFGDHWHLVLSEMLERVEATVAELDLLSEETRQRLVVDFNSTAAAAPGAATVHAYFEQQAARRPQSTAVVCGEERWTYRMLDRRANRLARHLQRSGVAPGQRVGIYLRHRPEMVMAVLGILKAGAAYVPLDPQHPSARLEWMLRDAGARLVVTEAELAGALPKDVRAICVDRDEARIGRHAGESLDVRNQASLPAYVIYTSGSTGTPKGVVIGHEALLNYIEWAQKVYVRGREVSFALYSSLAFDLTVTSLFVPLVSGNKIVVFRTEGRHVSTTLAEILGDPGVRALKLTPSHLALVKHLDHRRGTIDRLIVGGEPLAADLARCVWESFSGEVEIYNEYGPTEATVGCMIHRFNPASDDRKTVPIGAPADNIKIYILDEALRPVAENVVGELYIAGAGLAQGYLGAPGLTAQCFIADVFQKNERMYRSGDLARWLPGPLIEMAGRGDDQIKFHGHRLELEELRAVLNRHPKVRDSIVDVATDESGNQVLVAHYLARHDVPVDDLRDFLAESLFRETIPSFFTRLKRLPLTLQGKVNKEALPSLEEVKKKMSRNLGSGPKTATEEIVSGIWAEVLGLEKVGIQENFFELGGHSLMATRVVSRVREFFELEATVRTLFERPTVESFASWLEMTAKQSGPQTAPPMELAVRNRQLPVSFAQQRMWLVEQLTAGSNAYNLLLAVRLRGPLDKAVLRRSFQYLVTRHEALRTTIAVRDDQPVQVIRPAGRLEIPLIDLEALEPPSREEACAALAIAEKRRSFDLIRGPLFLVHLVRLDSGHHFFTLTMHHIIADGWSLEILVNEFAALYNAFVRGRPSPLTELPFQYADFACWQRRSLTGEVLDRQAVYWRDQLAGAPTLLALPTDYPRPAVPSFRGGYFSFDVSRELSARLQDLSRREGVTLFMTLLALLNTFIYRYSGLEDITVGTGIANRNLRDTEGLVGFFVNMLVLRTRLEGEMKFRDLLKTVREVALGAYAHQDLPFERVISELDQEGALGYTPYLQVVLVLHNVPPSKIRIPGLEFETMEIATETHHWDLMLSFSETDGALRAAVEYNADLFEQASIAAMTEHLRSLMAGASRDPGRELLHLPMARPSNDVISDLVHVAREQHERDTFAF